MAHPKGHTFLVVFLLGNGIDRLTNFSVRRGLKILGKKQKQKQDAHYQTQIAINNVIIL